MRTRVKLLTAKFVEHVSQPGKYRAGDGLYLIVGKDGKSKRWMLLYRRGKLGKKGKGELGLGKYPEVTLAAARLAVGAARLLIDQFIDPVEQRKQERRDRWVAEHKNLTFLDVAESLFKAKTEGNDPWWDKRTHAARLGRRKKYLTPLFALPINSVEAAEVITLKLYEIIKPLWLTRPVMMREVQHLAMSICRHAHDLKVLPMNVANPAGGPLKVLLSARQPASGHWCALPYQKAPALYAKLEELSRPAHSYFKTGEAARAVGKSQSDIIRMINRGELPAVKGKRHAKASIGYEWQIDGNELFARHPKVVDVIPGIQSVTFRLIMFTMLTGSRSTEARLMTWGEYVESERLWILPWKRTKKGRHILQDLIIPLSDPGARKSAPGAAAGRDRSDHARHAYRHALLGRRSALA